MQHTAHDAQRTAHTAQHISSRKPAVLTRTAHTHGTRHTHSPQPAHNTQHTQPTHSTQHTRASRSTVCAFSRMPFRSALSLAACSATSQSCGQWFVCWDACISNCWRAHVLGHGLVGMSCAGWLEGWARAPRPRGPVHTPAHNKTHKQTAALAWNLGASAASARISSASGSAVRTTSTLYAI